MTEREATGVYILRAGEQIDEYNPESGLKSEDRGLKYIRTIVTDVLGKRPFEINVCAPTPICQKTLAAFFSEKDALVWINRKYRIEAIPELFSTRIAEWKLIIQALGGRVGLNEKTLAYLKAAEIRGINEGQIKTGFLREEGERLFKVLHEMVMAQPKDEMILAVRQSPMIEAIMLWLMETDDHEFGVLPEFLASKQLGKLPLLNHCDALHLVYFEKQLSYVSTEDFSERVLAARANQIHNKEFASRRGI